MLKFKKIEIFLKLQKKVKFHCITAKINNNFPGIPSMETYCACLKVQKIISPSFLNFVNFKSYPALSKVQSHIEGVIVLVGTNLDGNMQESDTLSTVLIQDNHYSPCKLYYRK